MKSESKTTRYSGIAFAFALIAFALSTTNTSAATYFVATDGDDQHPGTIEQPFASVARSQEAAMPGDTVYIRGGTYRISESQIAYTRRIWAHVIRLNKSGTEGNRINYWAYQNERPVFDFSDVKPADKRVHAFSVSGSWIHIKGIEVIGVQVTITGHTQSICFANDGSNNIFEQLDMHDGHAIGIYSVRGSDNLFLNCDAYRNYDPVSQDGRGGNVDGFGCHPTKGSTGNVFRGCRAWWNSDDGFDCISASESVTFENCWAFWNGYSPEFERRADGNGFKVGGFASLPARLLPKPIPRHTVRFCVAVKNRANGFYGNHHIGGSDWINNTAYRNGANFNLLSRRDNNVDDVPGYGHFMRNNLSFGSRNLVTNLNDMASDVASNSFDLEVPVTKDDFIGLDEDQLTLPRQPGGDLPLMKLLHLTDASPLVDGGVDVGFPFVGKSPELGAFECSTNSSMPDSTSLKFQFGTDKQSPGFVAVPPETSYQHDRGYGWEPGVAMNASKSSVGSSHNPFYFSVDVPEGNYRVSVTLGDDQADSVTTVKAELRRLMLEKIRTAKGDSVTRTFVVNVRTPKIRGGSFVRLKQPRETVDEAWAWDECLTLEFGGERPSVQRIVVEPVDVPTVFILGDSTVCDQPHEPYASWGQMLPRFFRPDIAVANHAESGESLRSSTSAGRFDKVLAELNVGDFVLIQFGHNDMKSKDPNASQEYGKTLIDWVRQIKEKRATPVLITPVRRHRFEGDRVVDSLLDYPDRVRQAAAETQTALVDLNAMSKTLYETLGSHESKRLFKHDRDDDPRFDATHHSPYGAYELARCVVSGLHKAKVPLAGHVLGDLGEFDPAKPDSFVDFDVPVSGKRTTHRPLGD